MVPTRRDILRGIPVSVLLAMPAWSRAAQGWPERPIKLVVGSSAGSSIDLVARTFSQYLSGRLGKPVVVENRPGANGEIGTSSVARSKPDGYTLLLMPNNSLLVQLAGKSRYDVLADFAPVAISGRSPWMLSVTKTSPFRSIKDVVDYGRREPGKLTYVSIGGGIPDLIGKALSESASVELRPIPYPSTSDAKSDVMTGRVNLWFTAVATALALHESGQIRVLAVSGNTPPEALKNVPTMREAGYESLDVESSYFLLAPAGTSSTIIQRLNLEVNAAQKDQAVLDKLKSQGVLPRSGTPEDAAKLIRTELVRWSKLVKPITAK
jgi:tripartite-type tricarboxylate transporter receptor subunit TctC